MISLRPYQREAGNAFWRGMKEFRRQVIVLPTGTGKTVLGLAIAEKIGGRCLWVAHRDELITQPYDTCGAIFPSLRRGIVKASRNECDAQIVFASVQTIQRERRAAQLGSFDFVVSDECHHSISATWRQAIEAVGCFRDDGPHLLGLTATPDRTDNKRLSDVFERIAYVYHITQAIKDGYLVPIKYEQRPIGADLSGVKTKRNGDFDEVDLDLHLVRSGIVDRICNAVIAHPDRKTLVFTVSVAQSEAVAAQLAERGIAAAEVSGKTQIELRRARLRRFRSGDIRCLTNCMICTEGYDEPSIDCIIMARPTTSKPLYSQAIGRGLRISPGKTDCLVIDMVGASKHHTLIQAPVLFGSDDDAEREVRRQYEIDPDIAEWGERKLLLGQLQGLQPMVRSSMRWVSCRDGVVAISAGRGGTVVARKEAAGWTVTAIRGGGSSEVTVLVSGACLELAQGIAEDYVRRCEASGWVEKGARWRVEPATKKQIDVLNRLKIKIDGELTKGEASDFITQSTATDWRHEPATSKQVAALRARGVECSNEMTKQQARRLLYGGAR